MNCNWIMVTTEQAKEFAVAEAIDRITGGDWSYLPMELRLRTVSRRAGLKKPTDAVPILPRLVFMSASHRNLEEITPFNEKTGTGIRGVEGIIRDDQGRPEVIPSWEMKQFMDQVDLLREANLKRAARNQDKQAKPRKFKSFREAKEWIDKANLEAVDPETGEILEKVA